MRRNSNGFKTAGAPEQICDQNPLVANVIEAINAAASAGAIVSCSNLWWIR